MPKSVRIMIWFGLFIAVCGLGAWAVEGFAEKAKTAVIAGGGGGALMLLMAFLASSKSRSAQMIGIHLGMVLALALGAIYGWRAVVGAMSSEPKWALVALLGAMALAGLVSFVAILSNRPPPEARG